MGCVLAGPACPPQSVADPLREVREHGSNGRSRVGGVDAPDRPRESDWRETRRRHLKLFYFPVAPNPTKVLVYLAEKGLARRLADESREGVEIEMVRVSLIDGENRTPEFLARNPQGKLPVLELDDGTNLTESLAIIEYLEERFPEPPMLGATPEERAHARSIERIADVGVLMPTARAVHATRSPLGLPSNPPVAEAALEVRESTLGQLDERLAKTPFLAGNRVTVADCTLWAGLGFGSVFGIELNPTHENVARWRSEFGARPSTQLPG